MNNGPSPGFPRGRRGGRLGSYHLGGANETALSRRPFMDPAYEFRPVSVHEEEFQALKRQHPYFGYVDVEVENIAPFLMFSNNDDQVAQTYFWYGPDSFESLSLRIWSALVRRSNYVFDIGAFTGVYSLTAAYANREAQIYSFEPIKRIFGRLVVNLAVNRLGQRIEAYNVALSDIDDHADMNLSQGYLKLDTGASLIQKSGKDVVLQERIETARFDTFAGVHGIPAMDLAKIDVEQAEKMVIAGMPETLREHRPDLLVEVVSQKNLRDLADTLSPHGYNFAIVDDDTQKTHLNDLEAHRMTCNVLFTAMSLKELRDFCGSFEPLSQAGGEDDRHLAPDRLRRYRTREQELEGQLHELKGSLHELEGKLHGARREMHALQSTRGWKIANGINVSLTKVRRFLPLK